MTATQIKKTIPTDSLLEQGFVLPITQQLYDLAGIPDEHFGLFYRDPIRRFLSITQHCESSEIITHFNAVITSLKLRKTLILPLGADAENISKSRDVWTYCIFIGSLMFNSPQLVFRKVVYQHSPSQRYKRWSPFDPFIAPNTEVKTLGELNVTKYSSNALLTLVFCPLCMAWLYNNTDALNAALLLTHSPELTPVGKLVFEAHSHKGKNEDASNDVIPPEDEHIHAPISHLSFRDWLKSAIQDNQWGKHIIKVDGGYAVANPDAFLIYGKYAAIDAKTLDIEKDAFLQAGLHRDSYPVVFTSGKARNAFVIESIKSL